MSDSDNTSKPASLASLLPKELLEQLADTQVPSKELLEHLAHMQSPIQAVQSMLADIGDIHVKTYEDLWRQFSQDFAQEMQRSRNALDRIELLAKAGWTLPMSMSLPEFYALMENDLTVELVDELFIQYYIEADDTSCRIALRP